MIFLDTNPVIHLYAGTEDLPSAVMTAIDENDCYVSPMVRLELQYLYEVGRAKVSASDVLDALYREVGLTVDNSPFDSLILDTISLGWTRDPFDRIITGHAKAFDAPLVTRDKTILKKLCPCILGA